jgi:hypothetical protein
VSARTPWKWTQRNEDKPHRCPNCHAIAARAWSDNGYGPRTVMACCGLKWRAGVRSKRYRMAFKKELKEIRAGRGSTCPCCK